MRRSVHRLVNLCVREAFAAQSAEHSARAGARDAPRGSTRISHAAVRHGAPRSAACAGGGAREHGTAPARTARRGTEKWIPAQSLPIRPIRRRPGHPVPSTGSHPPAVGASARAYLLRRPVGARPRQLRRAGRPRPPRALRRQDARPSVPWRSPSSRRSTPSPRQPPLRAGRGARRLCHAREGQKGACTSFLSQANSQAAENAKSHGSRLRQCLRRGAALP